MNFLNLQYVPFLIGGFVILTGIILFYENKFFTLIQRYWFYRRSFLSRLSSLLFLTGMGFLLFSLLDVRGPEERIKTPVPKQRTIILIDTSASMLAEDVKPNRLQRAVLIAKHFARKAVGHQLSIVAFAEIQKPIVPFTNDLDLIDARLDSIKFLRNQYGSSALSVAVQEAIQYFYDGSEGMRGNLLVFTDGEETSGGVKLKIPDGIHVAFVGVGTTQGGKIPLDDGRGFRFGYKKERGQDVITKLDENFFKSTTSEIKSARYWLANTYSLPSEEILAFFKSEEKKAEEKQDLVARPVLMEWVVLPAILLLVLSWLLKSVRVFTLCLAFFIYSAEAQEEKVEYTPELIKKLQDLQAGHLGSRQKAKLADELYRAGAKADGLSLFEETLPKDQLDPDLPREAYLNYGTALLESGKAQEAFSVFDTLNSGLSDDAESRELRDKMKKNTASYFQQKKDQEQKKKENKDKKKEDQGQSGQGGEPQPSQSQSGGQEQKPQDKKDPQKNEDQKKDEKKNNEEKDNQGKDSEDEEKKEPEPREDSSEDKPKPRKKLAPKLKQLMSDDRQLQMRKIEQDTRDLNRRKQRNSKDW